MIIYEVVDCTDKEKHYTLGLVLSRHDVAQRLYTCIDPNDLGSPVPQDKYFQLEVRTRKVGWEVDSQTKTVYRRSWTWVFNYERNEGHWVDQVMLDTMGMEGE